MITIIRRLYDHMYWADDRVLEVLARVADESDAPVRRLFSHVLAAEQLWLLRLRGEDDGTRAVWPMLSRDELRELAARNREGYTDYLAGCGEARLGAEVPYTNSQGVSYRSAVADILTHVAMHGSYHRGQVAQRLREMGVSPVNTDFITFVREP